MMHDKNSKKPTDREYFRAIDAAVRGEHLYRNPDLQRKDIIKRFGLRRQHLNLILEQYASGQSFPAYINSIRLKQAERLLLKHPNMSIADVAESVGFTLPNYRIQFKKRYGFPPSELRAGRKKS